jgi:hypothetical protein
MSNLAAIDVWVADGAAVWAGVEVGELVAIGGVAVGELVAIGGVAVGLGLAAAGDGDGPVEPHAAATRTSARIAGDRR